MALLEVKVLSPAKTIANVTAQGVTVPGIEGYLTILPAHAAIISEMAIGELVVDQGSTKQHYFVSGGYIELQNDKLTVLADVIEAPEHIDIERALEASKRARSRLEKKDGDADILRAQRALRRAEVRMELAKVLGGLARSL